MTGTEKSVRLNALRTNSDMSIHRSEKDKEKQLEAIRRQFYGKNQLSNVYKLPASPSQGEPATAEEGSRKIESGMAYLQQDLLKIAVLSSLAIAVEIILSKLIF